MNLRIKFRSENIDQFIERYSVDVSRGGIFVRTREPLAVGTPIRFEFQLQNEAPIIAGEGTVVWIREYDASRPNVAPGMGVRFDRLSPNSQPVLEKILGEKTRRELAAAAQARPGTGSPAAGMAVRRTSGPVSPVGAASTTPAAAAGKQPEQAARAAALAAEAARITKPMPSKAAHVTAAGAPSPQQLRASDVVEAHATSVNSAPTSVGLNRSATTIGERTKVDGPRTKVDGPRTTVDGPRTTVDAPVATPGPEFPAERTEMEPGNVPGELNDAVTGKVDLAETLASEFAASTAPRTDAMAAPPQHGGVPGRNPAHLEVTAPRTVADGKASALASMSFQEPGQELGPKTNPTATPPAPVDDQVNTAPNEIPLEENEIPLEEIEDAGSAGAPPRTVTDAPAVQGKPDGKKDHAVVSTTAPAGRTADAAADQGKDTDDAETAVLDQAIAAAAVQASIAAGASVAPETSGAEGARGEVSPTDSLGTDIGNGVAETPASHDTGKKKGRAGKIVGISAVTAAILAAGGYMLLQRWPLRALLDPASAQDRVTQPEPTAAVTPAPDTTSAGAPAGAAVEAGKPAASAEPGQPPAAQPVQPGAAPATQPAAAEPAKPGAPEAAKPVAVEPTAAAAVEAAQPAAAPKKAAKKAAADADVGDGAAATPKYVLTVVSSPAGADVSLDGVRLGKTPYTSPSFDGGGTHVLTISKDGFASFEKNLSPGEGWTKKGAGMAQRVTAKLKKVKPEGSTGSAATSGTAEAVAEPDKAASEPKPAAEKPAAAAKPAAAEKPAAEKKAPEAKPAAEKPAASEKPAAEKKAPEAKPAAEKPAAAAKPALAEKPAAEKKAAEPKPAVEKKAAEPSATPATP